MSTDTNASQRDSATSLTFKILKMLVSIKKVVEDPDFGGGTGGGTTPVTQGADLQEVWMHTGI
jgi:hypothetical protein